MNTQVLQQAHHLVKDHYENFPVAPFFLPKGLRSAIALIYTFARTADDIADEGTYNNEERILRLNEMRDALNPKKDQTSFFVPLHAIIKKHNLSIQYFHDLLDAFTQDVTQQRYATAKDLLHYCTRSANPVGRLLLQLTNQNTLKNQQDSDRICTSLQLINFLQDIQCDLQQRNRLYIPLEDLNRFQVTVEDLKKNHLSDAINELISYQWERAHDQMLQGKNLGKRLPGLFGLDIRFIIAGGQCVLKKLKLRTHVYQRPKLRWYDWATIAIRGLYKK